MSGRPAAIGPDSQRNHWHPDQRTARSVHARGLARPELVQSILDKARRPGGRPGRPRRRPTKLGRLYRARADLHSQTLLEVLTRLRVMVRWISGRSFAIAVQCIEGVPAAREDLRYNPSPDTFDTIRTRQRPCWNHGGLCDTRCSGNSVAVGFWREFAVLQVDRNGRPRKIGCRIRAGPALARIV